MALKHVAIIFILMTSSFVFAATTQELLQERLASNLQGNKNQNLHQVLTGKTCDPSITYTSSTDYQYGCVCDPGTSTKFTKADGSIVTVCRCLYGSPDSSGICPSAPQCQTLTGPTRSCLLGWGIQKLSSTSIVCCPVNLFALEAVSLDIARARDLKEGLPYSADFAHWTGYLYLQCQDFKSASPNSDITCNPDAQGRNTYLLQASQTSYTCCALDKPYVRHSM